MSHTIHQEVSIASTPDRIYASLMDPAEFSARTGSAPAAIDRAEGGAFSIFGGHVTGRNIELVPNERIVQAWRAKTWPAGIYSVARFELRAEGGGTRIIFDHTGFPEDQQEHLATGWHENYWNTLKSALEVSTSA